MESDPPTPLNYQSTPPRRGMPRFAGWCVIAGCTAILTLPLCVAVTHALEDVMRRPLGWADATTVAEALGFALAGIMFLAGIASGVRARHLIHRDHARMVWAHVTTAATCLNAIGLGMVLLIVFVLGGKW